tara:strand:- start:261 stop:461 length:201 start_codon:yes stop_codon:yes gene_type:complete
MLRPLKSFSEFRFQQEESLDNLKLAEQKKKRKEELEKRMSDAYQKRQRQKKIKKLADIDSHWKGLN